MLTRAYLSYTNAHDFAKSALTSNGTVIKLVRSTSSDSDTDTYSPVTRFKIPSGAIIEFESSIGSNPPRYSKGEVVEVLYDETYPRNAKINSFFSLWGMPAILGSIGSIFILVGIGLQKKLFKT